MSILFNGSTANYYVDNTFTGITAAPFSMSCWYKPTNLDANVGLVWLGNRGSTQDYWYLGCGTSGEARFAARDNSTTTITVGTSSAGVWSHFGAVTASSSSRYAYLNGTESAEDTTPKTPDGSADFAVGIVADDSPSNPADGRIAHAAIWNVALEPWEMAALARGVCPADIRPQSLVPGNYFPMTSRASGTLSLYGWFGRSPTLADVGSPTFDPDDNPVIVYEDVASWSKSIAVTGGTTYESAFPATSGTSVGLSAVSTFPRAMGVDSGTDVSAAATSIFPRAMGVDSGTDASIAATSTFPRTMGITSGTQVSNSATIAFGRAFGVTSGSSITAAAVPAFVRAMGVTSGTNVSAAAVPAFGRAFGVTSGTSVGVGAKETFETALAINSGTSATNAAQAAFEAAFTATIGDAVTLAASLPGGTFESAMGVTVGASVTEKAGFTYASSFAVDTAVTAGMSALQFYEAAMAVASDVATTMAAVGAQSAAMSVDVAVQVENSTGCTLCGHMTVTVGAGTGKGTAVNTSGLTVGSAVEVRMRSARLWQEDGELVAIWTEDDPV